MVYKCQRAGCNAKKGVINGYCRQHHGNSNGNEAELHQTVADLVSENTNLKHHLKKATDAITNLYQHFNHLISAVNNSAYQSDEQEQYGRKEAFRVVDLPELPLKFDENGKIKDDEDCKAVAVEAAKLVGVTITKKDIQRAHRIGQRRVPANNQPPPKPRQLIVKLKDYSNRTSIVIKKKGLQDAAANAGVNKFSNAYIAEDLTPMRSKLLWYVKNHCNDKFYKCHTREGRIKAHIKGKSVSESSSWITLSSPNDLHKHMDTIDIDLLNKGMKKFKILKDIPVPNLNFSAVDE